MARRSSLLTAMKQSARAAERARKQQMASAKRADRAHDAYLKALERQSAAEAKAEAKERARLYTESRTAQVDLQNEELEQEIKQLNELLAATLPVDDYLDWETLKKALPEIKPFDSSLYPRPEAEPPIGKYIPNQLTALQKLIPGAKQRFEDQVKKLQSHYKQDLDKWKIREKERIQKLNTIKDAYEEKANTLLAEIKTHNSEIEQFEQDFAKGNPNAIVDYFTLVLEASNYPDDFPQEAKLAFVPESKQLVIEYDLPAFEIIPEVSVYKYVKSKDEITTSKRPLTQRKGLYASITAQIALRTIHELFEADRTKQLETIVFSGFVESINRATGRDQRTCLISVRTTRDVFTAIDLAKVDPILCLKNLNAAVSKSPDELEAVRPILEFNMVDKRFIQETDVLSSLDQRPNLMELTPGEFESLVTNLFAKMGLETRLTQASRDGGVDCVAFDPRPVLGGKVVIQAKRYKHTVGVSAVRDLFGTMHNEGATKGILVTTSGYGKAAFEFADGKPLELLSGSNLLYLLAEHAGIEAKIEVPDDWKDLNPDSPE